MNLFRHFLQFQGAEEILVHRVRTGNRVEGNDTWGLYAVDVPLRVSLFCGSRLLCQLFAVYEFVAPETRLPRHKVPDHRKHVALVIVST